MCGRGGECPARDITAAQILRVIRRGGIYAARCSQPGNATYRANRTERIYASPTNPPETPYHHGILQQQNSPPVGAGHAPPATKRQPLFTGLFVGTATMPPVAAKPIMRYNGQTARDAYMRPLQTCRKRPIITGYCNNKIHHPVGAGHAPPAT